MRVVENAVRGGDEASPRRDIQRKSAEANETNVT